MARRRHLLGGFLALLLAGCGPMNLGAGAGVGERVWSAVLPAADAPSRKVTVTAAADGSATLAQAVEGEPALPAQHGAWVQDGKLFQLRLAEPGSPRTTDRLIWVEEGDMLVPREWDRTLWGADGLTLTRER